MTSIDLELKQIVSYYLLQKKLQNLTKGNNVEEDKNIRNIYLVSTSILMNWKVNMNYTIISTYLDSMSIDSLKEENLKSLVMKYVEKNSIKFNKFNYFLFNSGFILTSPRIISKEYFPNLVNVEAFEEINKIKSIVFEKGQYIIKNRILALFFEKYQNIKVFLYQNEKNNLTNLTLFLIIQTYLKNIANYL